MSICMLKPFQEAFQDDAFGSVGDVFHSGDDFHAVVFECFLMDRRFILVSGKPVQFVNEDDLPALFGAVFYHTLKFGTVVVCSRHRPVDIGICNGDAVPLRILFTYAELTFDGLLRLVVG